MKRKNLMKLSIYLGVSAQLLLGQTFWDNGSVQFNYGTYLPTETWSSQGSIIPDSVGAGAGGYLSSTVDTSRLFAMGYQMSLVDSNLVGDLFVVLVTDSGEINTRTYIINPLLNPTTIFLWIPNLSSDFLTQIVAGNISPDSLLSLNVRVAVSGTINISQIAESSIDFTFQGAMLDPTTMETFVIANGVANLANALPTPDYIAGAVTFTFDGSSFNGSGNFNPILDAAGSGGVTTLDGDTTNYSLMSYVENGPDDYDIFGLTVRTLEPLSQGTVDLVIPGMQAAYPQAHAFYMRHATLADLYMMLSNPSMGSLDSLTTTEINVATSGQLTFTRTPDAWDGTFSAQMAPMGPLPVLIPLEDGIFHLVNQPYVGVLDQPTNTPADFHLAQSYPNPFNPSTRIPFSLNQAGQVRLEVYDLTGALVTTLLSGNYSAGNYTIVWQPANQASGIYVVRLTQGLRTQSQKILFLK